jgi:hypothetical protein
VEENESQKVLQVYPGFGNCPQVGTNHPVHPVTACALVFASPLKYQVLETSVPLGATIQATEDALHIRNPPCTNVPKGVPCPTHRHKFALILQLASLTAKVLTPLVNSVVFAILVRFLLLSITVVLEI